MKWEMKKGILISFKSYYLFHLLLIYPLHSLNICLKKKKREREKGEKKEKKKLNGLLFIPSNHSTIKIFNVKILFYWMNNSLSIYFPLLSTYVLFIHSDNRLITNHFLSLNVYDLKLFDRKTRNKIITFIKYILYRWALIKY